MADTDDFKEYISTRSKKTPLPSWPIQFTLAINVLKTTLGLLKNNISQAQLLTKSTHPIPINQFTISKVSIPRRKQVIPTPDFAPELAQGEFNAEWMVSKSVTFNSKGKIILFAHGGAYCICSPQTHRGITWRLAKYTRCKVLCTFYFIHFFNNMH